MSKDHALKERLITYNSDDCAALELVFNTVVGLQAGSNGGEPSSAFVQVESLKDQSSLKYKKNTFELPELEYINGAAYWDYQRSKIYLRTSPRLKHQNRRTASTSSLRFPLNKIIVDDSPLPSVCPRCGGEKIYRYGWLSNRVWDLKFSKSGIKRWIVKFLHPRLCCASCRLTFSPSKRYSPDGKYGPGFVAYLLYNLMDLQISQGALARTLNQFFGFRFARAHIRFVKLRAAVYYETAYKQILDRLAHGDLIHVDETKVRLQGREAFVWVFASFEDVAYVYSDTREATTPQNVLAEFKGVMVTDFYSAYDSIACRQQKCLIHLIRDLNDDLRQNPFNTEMQGLVKSFATLVRPMIETIDRYGLKVHYLRKYVRAVDRFYRHLAAQDYQTDLALKYRKRLEKNRTSLFTFLQIAAQDGPGSSELSDRPEQVCRQFVSLIQTCLEWHSSTWLTLEAEFHRLGLRWSAYYESTPPVTGANAQLRRLRNAVLGDLEQILKARAGSLRLQHLMRMRSEWCSLLPRTGKPEAAVTQQLRQSLLDAEPLTYRDAYDELIRLKNLEPDFSARRNLLSRLAVAAPAWASAIQNRHPLHSKPDPPGEPLAAWEWRQLHDELERRAGVSLDDLQQRIERLGFQLLDITSQLVEKLTWANLIRHTHHDQKQALGAYAAMRKKLTKSGRGVQDAAMRAGARREMTVAKGAVPVWIMPFNEVAETFDPRTARFDVVIIDEASQCDPTAMLALYLGNQTIIVGDDEQVTPVAVGVDMEQVQRLIQVHLQGIPHMELYDGEFSIYEFAHIAFGGVIRLVEHFRCAPNIIAFSNTLSYKGEIKPLREASAIRLQPHVLPYRVEGGRGNNDGVNDAEAEVVTSLICAAIEQPEYSVNESDKPMSFGVVSLVGGQQAMKVDGLLRQRLEHFQFKCLHIHTS